MTSIGKRIQTRRKQLRLTRAQLAEKMGTTYLRVWRIETGRSLVSLSKLPDWAKVLKATVAELVS